MKVHETGDFFNERFTKGVFFRQNGIQKDKRLDLELVAELPRIELNNCNKIAVVVSCYLSKPNG